MEHERFPAIQDESARVPRGRPTRDRTITVAGSTWGNSSGTGATPCANNASLRMSVKSVGHIAQGQMLDPYRGILSQSEHNFVRIAGHLCEELTDCSRSRLVHKGKTIR